MSFLNDIFGSKPKVPSLPSIEAAQGAALKSNVSNFAEAAKLATMVDTFNQNQLAALMEKQLPGGAAKIRDLISSRLAGEIPDDVLRQLRRSNAERTAGALTGSSGFSLGSGLTNELGMSLQIQDSGFNSALSWMQATKAPTWDIGQSFISTEAKYADYVNQFNRDFTESKIKASPDPVARGLFDTGMEILGMVASMKGGSLQHQSYNPSGMWGGGSGMTSAGGGTGFGSMGGFGGSYAPSNSGGGGFAFGIGKAPGGGWFLGSKPGKG